MQPDIDCDLDHTSASALRQLVRVLLDGRTDVRVDDALLVTDELASNAIRHGEAPRGSRLWLLDQGRRLRIEVTDSGPGQPRMITPHHAGGRGLRLVDRLASSWGVRRHADGKTVWAEVHLDGRSDNDPVVRLVLRS